MQLLARGSRLARKTRSCFPAAAAGAAGAARQEQRRGLHELLTAAASIDPGAAAAAAHAAAPVLNPMVDALSSEPSAVADAAAVAASIAGPPPAITSPAAPVLEAIAAEEEAARLAVEAAVKEALDAAAAVAAAAPLVGPEAVRFLALSPPVAGQVRALPTPTPHPFCIPSASLLHPFLPADAVPTEGTHGLGSGRGAARAFPLDSHLSTTFLIWQVLFLSPLQAMRTFRVAGTGDTSILPYAAMAANGCAWTT